MSLVTDRAICLRKTEYSETSQVLTLFCRENGVVRLLAKGAHRRTKAGSSKFDGGVDLLDLGTCVFSLRLDKNLPPLTEWKLIDAHAGLHSSLRVMHLGLLASEVLGFLFEEHDAHPEIFDRFERTLTLLPGERGEEISIAFQLALLREAGFLPQLEACVVCGDVIETETLHFSPARGGIVCSHCVDATPDRSPISDRTLQTLRTYGQLLEQRVSVGRFPRVTRADADAVYRTLLAHTEHRINRRLRLRSYVLPATL